MFYNSADTEVIWGEFELLLYLTLQTALQMLKDDTPAHDAAKDLYFSNRIPRKSSY